MIRVLISVNLVVLLSLLARGQGLAFNFQEFVETAMLVEAICLGSLLLLCGFRRVVEQRGAAAWLQRMACGVVPALLGYLVLASLASMEWFVFSFPRLNWGFSVLLCFLMGVVLQNYFELRTRAFSPALGEARLQALQARIRPHFLFNSLNAVLSLIRSEPRRAETALEDLADLFRVLMRDTREQSSLHDEIVLCKQYLAIEKIRLGERLMVEWRISNLDEKALSESKIPVLLLQPLLENAVHYGVEPSTKPALIDIEVQKILDKIEVKVTNPYHQEAQMSLGNHMALDNIRQRLKLLYDIEAQLSTNMADGMFVVQLIFPAH
ncbi:MAG: histidine kinase [Undibacterium sp.]|nr:histidine kinase [Undibacterium sp.]